MQPQILALVQKCPRLGIKTYGQTRFTLIANVLLTLCANWKNRVLRHFGRPDTGRWSAALGGLVRVDGWYLRSAPTWRFAVGARSKCVFRHVSRRCETFYEVWNRFEKVDFFEILVGQTPAGAHCRRVVW